MEFLNPDYNKEEAFAFIDEEQYRRPPKNQFKALNYLSGDRQEERRQTLIIIMVRQFYEKIKKS